MVVVQHSSRLVSILLDEKTWPVGKPCGLVVRVQKNMPPAVHFVESGPFKDLAAFFKKQTAYLLTTLVKSGSSGEWKSVQCNPDTLHQIINHMNTDRPICIVLTSSLDIAQQARIMPANAPAALEIMQDEASPYFIGHINNQQVSRFATASMLPPIEGTLLIFIPRALYRSSDENTSAIYPDKASMISQHRIKMVPVIPGSDTPRSDLWMHDVDVEAIMATYQPDDDSSDFSDGGNGEFYEVDGKRFFRRHRLQPEEDGPSAYNLKTRYVESELIAHRTLTDATVIAVDDSTAVAPPQDVLVPATVIDIDESNGDEATRGSDGGFFARVDQAVANFFGLS